MRQRFEARFLNSDKFSSIHQFKPEVSGRLPELFLEFVEEELQAERGKLAVSVAKLTRNIPPPEAHGSGQGQYNSALLDVLALLNPSSQ